MRTGGTRHLQLMAALERNLYGFVLILTLMVELFTNPVVAVVGGAAVILLPTALVFWFLGAAMPKLAERFVPRTNNDIIALDPAHQHKVDQLMQAAAEIRGEGISRDLKDIEEFAAKRRKIAAELRGLN